MTEPSVSVIVPTIAGRMYLERTVAAFRAEPEVLEVLVVRGRPCCGDAWADGAKEAQGDFVLLGADDAPPVPGAIGAAVESVERDGVYPAPRIVRPNGSVEACGSMGGGLLLKDCPTGTPCVSSPFPFMRNFDALLGDAVENVRGMHYWADDLLAQYARVARYRVEVVRDYAFEHLEDVHGRGKLVARSRRDEATFRRRAAHVLAPREIERHG